MSQPPAKQCQGCSRVFKYLAPGTSKCQPCLAKPPSHLPEQDWPLCHDCGSVFEFMVGRTCSACVNRETQASSAMPPPPPPPISLPHVPDAQTSNPSPISDVHFAMQNPANPRTNGVNSGQPYSNPAQVLVDYRNADDPDDPRTRRGNELMGDYTMAYQNSYSRNISGRKIARPVGKAVSSANTPSIPTSSRPAATSRRTINVAVRKVTNRGNKKPRITFDVQITSYSEDRSWSDVVNNIRVWLDGHYYQQLNFRIRSLSQFTLQFTNSDASISSITIPDGALLGNVWAAAIAQPGLHVSTKSIKLLVLDLDATVDYRAQSPDPTSNYISSFNQEPHSGTTFPSTRTRPGKRKATSPDSDNDDTSGHYQPTRKTAYYTTIAPRRNNHIDTFTNAVKLTPVMPAQGTEDKVRWIDVKERVVTVAKTHFAQGRTKKAYKMHIGTKTYAAKNFFFAGDTDSSAPPDKHENLALLKEELVRQKSLAAALKEFLDVASKRNISICDLQVSDGFIIKLNDGSDAWLVDHYLNPEKMHKFSGSDKAGSNRDLPGMTCDAFAHFTLEDSGLELVPVDIQGIEHTPDVDGIKGAPCYILFDLMAHSLSRSMGLGDNGRAGIKKFCEQHKCNKICHKFNLTPAQQFLADLEGEDSDAEFEHIHPPDSRPISSTSKDSNAQTPEDRLSDLNPAAGNVSGHGNSGAEEDRLSNSDKEGLDGEELGTGDKDD
ncbi:kinase-like protein [Agrocybe pediades]|nr:kinase-like protein [Agrocybe pediades]